MSGNAEENSASEDPHQLYQDVLSLVPAQECEKVQGLLESIQRVGYHQKEQEVEEEQKMNGRILSSKDTILSVEGSDILNKIFQFVGRHQYVLVGSVCKAWKAMYSIVHGQTTHFAAAFCTCLLYTSPSPRD